MATVRVTRMSSSIEWVVLGTALVVSLLVFLRFRRKKIVYILPPGPAGWPIVGNIPLLFDAKKLPHEVFGDLAKVYGGIVTVKLGAVTMIYITDPDIIKECLTANDQLLANRPPAAAFKYGSYGENGAISLTQYGDHWRYTRRLLATELLNQKRMEQFDYVRGDEVTLAIHETFQASKRKESVNLHDIFSKSVMNMLTRTAFGKRLYASAGDVLGKTKEEISSGQKMSLCVEGMLEVLLEFMVEDFIPRLSWMDIMTGTRRKMKKIFQEFDIVMSDLVDGRIKEKEARRLKGEVDNGRDLLDVLLSLRDRGGVDATHLDERNIKAMLLDLVGAGSVTTIALAEYALAELMANPEVMAKAQAELDSVVGQDRSVTTMDVDNMPYMQAVVKEVLRLHTGPALLPRCNLVDCKIAGYDIPANSFISLAMYVVHRNEKDWEEPLKFKPERFLNTNLEVTGKEYFYTPFGAGRRMCPGYSMATKTLQFMVARFVHSFDWSLPNGLPVTEVDLNEKVGLAISKRVPLEAIPSPRLAPLLYGL